jgi:hypothetical protein
MHEYRRRINLAEKNGAFAGGGGTLYDVTVEHDDGCPVLIGNSGECRCDPGITVASWARGKEPPTDPPNDIFTINAAGKRSPLRRQP